MKSPPVIVGLLGVIRLLAFARRYMGIWSERSLALSTDFAAVLWDLRVQPDYRMIHALFLDDVDLALVLFDPTNRQEPLKGMEPALGLEPRTC